MTLMPTAIKTFRLWPMVLALLGIANATYLLHNFIGWVLTLSAFILIPGYLFITRLNLKGVGNLTKFCIAVSTGLLLLMLAGLLLNALHILGVKRPLSAPFIFSAVNIYCLILSVINRKVRVTLRPPSLHISISRLISLFICVLLPCLAIFGAIRLNNGASNVLTMIMFGLIGIFIIWLTMHEDHQDLYPLAIFSIGVSVLFSTSLRGWTITGHDIQHEFQVFQSTYNLGFWTTSQYKGDPYNACLSITILPTMLQNITGIPAEYIYKAVFQFIFAIGILPIYLITKKFCNATLALLACIVFISFPPFITDLPYLNRQELAFVFLGVTLLVNFVVPDKKAKLTLTCLGLISITLSHYSSAYVTLGLLIISLITFLIVKKRTLSNNSYFIPVLMPSIIIMSLLFTFLWNSQITTSTKGLDSTVTKTIRGLWGDTDAQNAGVKYSFFSAPRINPIRTLEQYAGDNASKVQYVPTPDMQPTSLGKQIKKVTNVNSLNGQVRAIIGRFYQLLLMIGVFIFFYRARKRVTPETLYVACLSFASLAFLGAMIVLPQLSVDYSVTRLFQQTLIVTAIPIVVAAELIFRKFRHYRLLIGIFFALLFLDLSGFVPQLLGAYQAQMSLNNSGLYYNIYYETSGEIVSARWLNNIDDTSSIAADSYTKMHFPNYPFTSKHVNNPILASPNTKYLFLDDSNIKTGRYTSFLNGSVIEYIFRSPIQDGDLIYSNNSSEIYQR